MTEKKKDNYVDCIVNRQFPKQKSFTAEEAKYLVDVTLCWAAEQLDHEIGETMHKDIPSLVNNCEYESIEDAIEDTQLFWEEQMLGLRDFIFECVE